MRPKIAISIMVFLFVHTLFAQHAAFLKSGIIRFERKVNTFAAYEIFLKESKFVPEDQIPTAISQYRSSAPQFWTDSFDLYFDETHSLYQPNDTNVEYSKTFQIPVAYKNKVYSNRNTGEVLSEKQAYEQSLFVRDSLRKIKWKYTGETRKFAGIGGILPGEGRAGRCRQEAMISEVCSK